MSLCQYTYFKSMSKVVKYTCIATRYNYTHDQLNTNYILTIYKEYFLGGGGCAKFNFAPGRQLPSLRHWFKLSVPKKSAESVSIGTG